MHGGPAHFNESADDCIFWRTNLYICMLGSFSTFMGMTLTFPFLSLYIQTLGVRDPDLVIQWSAIAYVVTFAFAMMAAPVWGSMSDRFGNKFTLMRASLGTALVIFCMGLVQDVYQLTGMRLLLGCVGGYTSGAIILVSRQTPGIHSAWALSMLSSSALAGSLMGPMLGGGLAELVGLRYTFFISASVILMSFILTRFFIIEIHHRPPERRIALRIALRDVRDVKCVIALFLTTLMIISCYMSIEPFIAIYVMSLLGESGNTSLLTGLAVSSTALGSILFSPFAGRASNKAGPLNLITLSLVITGCLIIPQAFITRTQEFIFLRFLMGLTLAGLIPTITVLVKENVSPQHAGTLLGWLMSVQYLGQIAGPLAGAAIARHFNIHAVFISTACLLIATGTVNWFLLKNRACL